MTLCSAWPFSITLFSVRVAVGQACTHAPHETHSESMNGLSWLAATFESKPRAWMVCALVAIANVAQPDDTRHVLQLAMPVGRAGETVERVIGDVKLHHPAPDI